ncbi:U-box domain-containing protein 62 [Arachis duranensis]|uniref:U-box domain-containing protein 62 n=1 Tax=Arachis duranensis TaxID=130453 RepID=A0A6P4C691_ARADU|nr:U-box domain-containing protein 62 [Arachis duranensis]
MSSEDIGLVPDQRIETGLSSSLVFQDETLRFSCGGPQRRVGDPGPKTRDLGGFIDDKMFSMERDRYFAAQGSEFRRSVYGDCSGRRDPPGARNWSRNGGANTPSGDESDGDDDEDDDEDDDDDDDVEGDEGLVGVGDGSKRNSNPILDINGSNGSNGGGGGSLGGVTAAERMANGKGQHHSSYVSTREMLGKDGDMGQLVHNNASGTDEDHHQRERLGKSQSAVTIAETDCDEYYSHYLHGTEGSGSVQKVMVDENGCGFSGRKDVLFSSESGESLRAILSDPVTGALMDDAMILPCGHSFGGGGIQHVIRMKACCTCSQPTSEESISQNLSLRAAVQAYRREEESQFYRSSKRRRERFDQGGFGDSAVVEPPRGRGVQFPFAVMDRVIIKGNKRTPQRFVGREAIVTTQCLNGWYVVKTLDNAESVKLQYRSLAKVLDDSSKPSSTKMPPNWR